MDNLKNNLANEEAEQTYDTSEPLEVNKARKRAARTRADRLEFVQAAMTTEQGRAWYYDLLKRCRVFNNPMALDPHKTSFQCGQLNIGLQVLDDIQTAAPESYITMVMENKTKNG